MDVLTGVIEQANMDADINDNEDYVAPNGLSSRKRMHDSYRIMQANDVERQSGSEDAVISVSPNVTRIVSCFVFLRNPFAASTCPASATFAWSVGECGGWFTDLFGLKEEDEFHSSIYQPVRDTADEVFCCIARFL